jgi:hypothetical protein
MNKPIVQHLLFPILSCEVTPIQTCIVKPVPTPPMAPAVVLYFGFTACNRVQIFGRSSRRRRQYLRSSFPVNIPMQIFFCVYAGVKAFL